MYIIRKDTGIVNGTLSIVPQTASEGETIQVTAAPNAGYELSEEGTKGISDGSNMDGNLTREQLATMLYRYAGAPAVTGTLNGFADASSVSDYAKQAMVWAVENGLITGVTNSTLAPQGEATRVQVAAILQRYIQSMV